MDSDQFCCIQPQNSLCQCYDKVLCFLVILFTFTLGLLLGSIIEVFAAVTLILIIFAVVFAILIAGLLIYKYCICCKKRS